MDGCAILSPKDLLLCAWLPPLASSPRSFCCLAEWHLQIDSILSMLSLFKTKTLFIEHQIPTDLLAYAGNASSGQERLQQVKQHVASMKDMLVQMKGEQVSEKQAEREYAGANKPAGKQHHWDIKPSIGSTKTRGIGDIVLSSGSGDTGSVHIASGASAVGNSGSVHIHGGAGGGTDGGVELSFGLGGAVGYVEGGVVGSSDDGISVFEWDVGIARDDYHMEPIAHDAPPLAAAGSSQSAAAPTTQQARTAGKRGLEHPPDTSIATHDFTKYLLLLDKAFDGHTAVRPTIMTVGDTWQCTGRKALLAAARSNALTAKHQHTERQAAFDLLDALTRSGALPLEHAALHVVVAVTHSFADSVMDSLVLRNINPIADIERTSIVLASTLLGKTTEMLLQAKHWERLGDNTLVHNATAPVWM